MFRDSQTVRVEVINRSVLVVALWACRCIWVTQVRVHRLIQQPGNNDRNRNSLGRVVNITCKTKGLLHSMSCCHNLAEMAAHCFDLSKRRINSYLFIFWLFCYVACVCRCCVCVKPPSDLSMTSVPYVYHIWSLLCCFTLSLFRDSTMTFQRPAGTCLWGTWENVVGTQTDKVPLEPLFHKKYIQTRHEQLHSFKIP